jgi:hypothetical protein
MSQNVCKLLFLLVLGCTGCQQDHHPDPWADVRTAKHDYEEVSGDIAHLEEYQTNASFGELIYVPIYASIFQWGGSTHDLTVTLSIHNIDLEKSIRLIKVNYYNTNGKLLRRYIKEPITLTPLQTSQFVIKQMDRAGGTGANFVVQWISESDVTSPITEAVMISTSNQQGLSFTSPGKVIRSFQQKTVVPIEQK